uniref:Alpha 1,4-glycosyltransferase domain-containing protein n=1 Tax=Monodelphis domestica TaxID=13616 RepID=A0A5F8GSF0_MONDO
MPKSGAPPTSHAAQSRLESERARCARRRKGTFRRIQTREGGLGAPAVEAREIREGLLEAASVWGGKGGPVGRGCPARRGVHYSYPLIGLDSGETRHRSWAPSLRGEGRGGEAGRGGAPAREVEPAVPSCLDQSGAGASESRRRKHGQVAGARAEVRAVGRPSQARGPRLRHALLAGGAPTREPAAPRARRGHVPPRPSRPGGPRGHLLCGDFGAHRARLSLHVLRGVGLQDSPAGQRRGPHEGPGGEQLLPAQEPGRLPAQLLPQRGVPGPGPGRPFPGHPSGRLVRVHRPPVAALPPPRPVRRRPDSPHVEVRRRLSGHGLHRPQEPGKPQQRAGRPVQVHAQRGLPRLRARPRLHPAVHAGLRGPLQRLGVGPQGPQLVTRVFKRWCGEKSLREGQSCRGVRALPREAFYPVAWQDWRRYFQDVSFPESRRLLRDTYAVHVWNKKSQGARFQVTSRVLLARLYSQYCPTTAGAMRAYL